MSAFRPVSRGQVQTSLKSAACKMDVYDESLLQPIEPAKGTEERKCCSTIFVLKVLYFLAGLSGATFGRYATIFFVLKGLSTFQIGLIGGITPFVRALAQPLWGFIADKFRIRKLIFLITSAASSAAILSLDVKSVSSSFDNIFLVMCVMCLFTCWGVVDAYAIEELKKQNRADDYGKLRLWTAVSWGGGTSIMGYFADAYGFGMVFTIFGIFQGINLVMIWCFVPDLTNDERAAKRQNREEPDTSVLFAALLRPQVIILLLLVTIFGAGFAVVDQLLFVYLIEDFGASKLLCGLTVGCTVLLELPIFYHGQKILKNIGPQVMMAIALLAFLIRMFGYTLLTTETVNYILLLECLHGITFGMMWTATVSIVANISPPDWKTTTMTLVQALTACLGPGIGTLVGGWVAQTYGFKFMYRLWGYVFTVVLAFHLLAWACGVFRFQDQSESLQSDRDSYVAEDYNST